MKELYLFLIFLITKIFGASENFDDSICDSEECRKLSDLYLLKMNPEADPCEDFYEFACGNYENNYKLPELDYNTLPQEMKRNLTTWWEEHLTNWDLEQNWSFLMELVKNYTKSCVDENSKIALDLQDLRKIIDSQFGGWHLLDNTTEHFDWEVLAGTLSLYGFHTLIKPHVKMSWENGLKNILAMKTQLKYYEKMYFRMKKTFLIDDVFELLNITDYDPKIVEDIIDFDLNLNDLLQYNNNSYFEIQTVAEFKSQHNNINWTAYFTKELRDAMPHLLTSQEMIQNENPDFFNALNHLLKNTSKETIKNYLFFELVSKFFLHMSKKYREPFEKFSNIYEEDYNNQYCAEDTKRIFPLIVAGEYVKIHHTENETMNVEKILANLKKVMIDEIRNSEWMSRKSKEEAIEKVRKMHRKIGHPSWFDDLNIGTIYGILGQPIEINPGDYLRNYLKIKKINQMDVFAQLEYSSMSEWGYFVTRINAFYASRRNEMIIPAAILTFPFINENSPLPINYGGIGVTLAHEMIHGFDGKGRFYDDYGERFYWWDDLTSEMYDNKTQYFIDQYDLEVEKVTNLNFDGKLTLDENIADNVGVKIAWLAYKLQAQDAWKLPKLEKYTSDQLYFISLANVHCTSATRDVRESLLDSVHTFGATRLNVPLRNFPKFGEVFNCEIGSGMMPNETCRIW